MARPNGVREAWAAGQGGHQRLAWHPSSFSAEIMAACGWDSLVVDMQHGLIDYQMLVTMLQGDLDHRMRPRWCGCRGTPAHIQKPLDAGAYGIVCPMINNPAEAEEFIGSCRYAPLGHRSSGPIRASLYAGADYRPRPTTSSSPSP